ncbi:hypothetical protein ABFU65_12210 [Xanthomonas campestris pv. raphani]|uniref:hypothetical protein n=1 Tax=Xanthomonas campestris TaxID=339 RepID=UPI002B235F42|nr:hypothetical protein [Xanthomonas campestris]MEB1025970.1 hypothetical protein [Xanthomonas campestris pv. campestris]MEA9653039.1 hypothetical protein [Xanthomonas campestris pv. raphani]MEB1134267.1 hypothetical protein [Xanthomonas campestris pv. campestris]MEB1146733.1 hypothetical protein [Xanthomonas campestris pv. campestris]MEB1937046.1 hypothetical protein [Xanthomonas campestris pv. campestris]
MSRIINYVFDHPYANKNDDDRGQIEVPDDATDEQIDAEVRELFFNTYNYGWSEADQQAKPEVQ